LTESKYAFAPRATDAYEAAGPVSGEVPPRRIVVEVTPGSADEPASASGAATATARAVATSVDRRRIYLGGECRRRPKSWPTRRKRPPTPFGSTNMRRMSTTP